MYILDTDHLSVLDRGGMGAQRLIAKLATIDPAQVAVSIISYEEQMRGWLSYIAKTQPIEQQVFAYQQLKKQLANYCTIPVLGFEQPSVPIFQRIRQAYPRLGTMDLKIAAIALSNSAVLLTRNRADFGQIAGLMSEDWT